MLKTVTIKNFRLFKEFDIANLESVNLIVGKNNVGKSSLLEALYLLVNPDTFSVLPKLLESRGEFSQQNYDLTHLFWGHHLQNESLISIQSENINLKITFPNNQLPVFNEGEPSQQKRLVLEYQGTESHGGSRYELSFDRRAWLGYESQTQSSSNYVDTKGINYETLAELWDTITLTPKEDDVINMLQILEPTAERISFQSRQTHNSGILIKCRGQDKPFPLGSMGDGMYRILAMAIALANSENGYLFIDEIDTGLHYRTITDLWNLIFKTAERLNVQVFATTHSSDCLVSFTEALNLPQNEGLGKLFRLERRQEKIVAVEYGSEDLTTAMREDIEVR